MSTPLARHCPALSGQPPYRAQRRLSAAAPATSARAVARTIVEFRTVDQRLMDWYLASGEWRGRAGGYAIQGRGRRRLVARIEATI